MFCNTSRSQSENWVKKIQAVAYNSARTVTQNFLGEHKVITQEQQFLGVILSFFYALVNNSAYNNDNNYIYT